MDSTLSLPTLAALAGLPVSNFIVAFTATFGASPYQFVLDRRILTAKMLLTTTNMPVHAIGIAVGFTTPSHFTATFRKRTALTPGE